MNSKEANQKLNELDRQIDLLNEQIKVFYNLGLGIIPINDLSEGEK